MRDTDDPLAVAGEQPRRRRITLRRGQVATGQAIVEFSIVSLAFFALVFGTIDFGRAIYMYSQLNNAVREGARTGKLDPTQETTIKDKVIDYASAFDLVAADVTVTCDGGGCTADSESVTVEAEASFTAITQDLLGISPLTLHSSATVEVE